MTISPASREVADLIARCALRDRVAFRLLYERTSAKLFGVVLRILRDRGEAEDAIQDVYVKIWQRADRFVVGQTSPISWLVAVARNHALDRVRARRPAAEDLDVAVELADEAPTPDRLAEASEEGARIEKCLATLEPDRAEAVRGAYLDGFSYEELASRYAVPLNTMRTWLRRSLIKLRECLAP
ncbi:MAG: sigma-70 family RNA polymerase sigma factor [Devosia sp.]|nr:sigma-70 family RNA polymerase sigma factor [Devosia sp.]